MINKWYYQDVFLVKFAACALALHIVHGTFMQYLVGMWFDIILISSTSVILLLLYIKNRKIVIFKEMLGWGCIAVFAIFHSGSNGYSNVIAILTFVFSLFVMLFSGNRPEFASSFLKYSVWMALISALSALLFYAYPHLYNSIFSIYGGFVANTDGGSFGYRAGITPHTSWQGIICSIGVLYDGCVLITDGKEMTRKSKMLRLIRMNIFFCALVLSAKRGPMLFTIISLLFIYTYVRPTKARWKILFFLIGGIILYFSFDHIVTFIPGLEYMIARFAGTKDVSSYRFQMWKVAFNEFIEHPLIGIGWLQYRDVFSKQLFSRLNFRNEFIYTDAHNVYIQILCETGIIGFCIYIFTVSKVLIKSFDQVWFWVKGDNKTCQKSIIIVCFSIQLFFLLYSLSGNPLYDYTFIFYMVSCGITYSFGKLV